MKKILLLTLPFLLVGCNPSTPEIKEIGYLKKENINTYFNINTTKSQAKTGTNEWTQTFSVSITNLFNDYWYSGASIQYNWYSPKIKIPENGILTNYQWQYHTSFEMDMSSVNLELIYVGGTIYKK